MSYKFNPFTGTLDEVGAGGGGTPGGSDTQVQFNDGGSFGGSADLTWDDSAKELGVGGDINLDDGGTYTTTLQMVTPTADRTISFPDATGTVALVAGSSGQLTYNSAGANAGDSGLLYDATSGSLTVGGKTVTTDAPVINLSQTWNNAATTFTGLKLNVTDTASAAGSNLLDLQVNGTSKFKVRNDGYITTYAPIQVGVYGIISQNNSIYLGFGAAQSYHYSITTYGVICRSTLAFAWSSTNSSTGTPDLALFRDQANVLKVTDGSTGTGYIKQVPVAVSALPSAATVGAGTRGFVNDANATTFASVVAGGGANVVPVYSDGTDWRIG